ncbi:MAG: reverse transcriptase/maturase family protein [bacterium]|nr:reverse transcriptase/maturase family protein [bacterium]
MHHTLENITSVENLLAAWREFLPGKRNKLDVQAFSLRLIDNILELHHELTQGMYRHGLYTHFRISDPKPRDIHKATVRDRLVHHAIYRALYPFFSRTFIVDSFSCQLGKGTHRAMQRFKTFVNQVSKNNTRTCWVLKGDIRKFFASIDQTVLLRLLAERIPDTRIMRLLQEVIQSFSWKSGTGLPLGNLTSQLFVNIYMTPFDQWVKHQLKAEYYLRYADDFAILSDNRKWLQRLVPTIQDFLQTNLRLDLHPHKVFIQTLASGVDFLGWVHFPKHRVLRTSTKRRMFARLVDHPAEPTVQSYLGLLQHGDARKLHAQVIHQIDDNRGLTGFPLSCYTL